MQIDLYVCVFVYLCVILDENLFVDTVEHQPTFAPTQSPGFAAASKCQDLLM